MLLSEMRSHELFHIYVLETLWQGIHIHSGSVA
jgi:hypothetical protein